MYTADAKLALFHMDRVKIYKTDVCMKLYECQLKIFPGFAIGKTAIFDKIAMNIYKALVTTSGGQTVDTFWCLSGEGPPRYKANNILLHHHLALTNYNPNSIGSLRTNFYQLNMQMD